MLEFKLRRADELNSLHLTLEMAYLEAIKSPDPGLSAKHAIRTLDKSIQNLHIVSAEKWQSIPKYDFSIELNLDCNRLIQGIAAGAVFDFYTNGFTIPMCSIVGGIASILKFKASYSAAFIPATNQEKLAYLSHAKDEHIL